MYNKQDCTLAISTIHSHLSSIQQPSINSMGRDSGILSSSSFASALCHFSVRETLKLRAAKHGVGPFPVIFQ